MDSDCPGSHSCQMVEQLVLFQPLHSSPIGHGRGCLIPSDGTASGSCPTLPITTCTIAFSHLVWLGLVSSLYPTCMKVLLSWDGCGTEQAASVKVKKPPAAVIIIVITLLCCLLNMLAI